MMTYFMFDKLIKFQNDHTFHHNGFIRADKSYLDIFFNKNKTIRKTLWG